jgi:amidase
VCSASTRELARTTELDGQLERTGELSGPLHGIPVLVKDCVETSGIPTTFGSEAIVNYVPSAMP